MVKIGLIGLGKWGKNHLRSLSELNCNIVGVSDVDICKKELAEKYGIDFFSDYKKLLPKVDALAITTPTDIHYETVVNCLNAGKHVLVEKPIASSSEESKKLIELAKSKNLILSVGYLFRFNNSIKRVKELMKEIGEIQYITCRYIHSTKPPRKDSGAILNLGIHPIDILNFITGRRPVKVFAKKKNLLSKELEDSAVVMFDYKDFFATVEVSCTHPEKKRDMWIIAEKEKLYVDYFNQKIVRYPIIVSYENVERKDSFEEKIPANEPLKDELDYFIKLVEKKNEKGFADIENIGRENYYTTLMCELSIKSAGTGEELIIK
jgi:UDP-N-acetylglucosamine 3-dehydrogenase